MTVGKQIKVTLTLDDSGFSAKSKGAQEAANILNTGLITVGKTVGSVEKSIATLGKSVSGLPKSFASMEKVVAGNSAVMERLIEKITGLSGASRRLKADADGVSGSIGGIGKQAAATAVSIAQMKPSLASAEAAYKGLDRAATASAKAAKDSATASVDARLKALKGEKQANAELLSSRENLYRQLRKAQNEFEARALAASIEADRIRATRKAGSARQATVQQGEANRYSVSAATIGSQLAAMDALLPKMRSEQVARAGGIKQLEQERVAILQAADAAKTRSAIEAYVSKKNAEEVKRIIKARAAADKEADKESAESAAQLAAQRKRYNREVAAEKKAQDAAVRESQAAQAAQVRAQAAEQRSLAAEQRAQAQAIAGMFRNMAGMWAAAKIEKGVGSSVGAADEMERQKVGVKTLNLPGSEEAGLYGSAAVMAKNLGFISQLDAIKSRMSAIASIGYNNVEMIDKTLPTIVKAANNLQYLGMGHGTTQDMIRNIYGVVEMRQLANDPQRTNDTANVVQKIVTGTAGKVQTSDLETVLRQVGIGASQVSDDGMIRLAAVIDQFKVSGGGDGGSAGGVSKVGTMIKMFQSYVLGKGLSNSAITEFSGAGLLNEEGLSGLGKDKSGAFKEAKHAGLKNADLWMKDPVKAMQAIFPQVIAYTQKNQKKYYSDGNGNLKDMNDPAAQMIAFSKYLSYLGITTTAQAFGVVGGDPRSAKRIEHQYDTIKGSKNVNEVDDLQKETYGRQLLETKVILTDIAGLVGAQLLPPLNSVLNVVKDILSSFRDFAANNPAELKFLAITAAVGGMVLGVKSAMGLFGLVGGMLSGITTILGAGTAATATATTAWGGMTRIVTTLALAFPGMAAMIDVAIAAAVRLGSAMIAPFASIGLGIAGALGWIGKLSGALLGFIVRWASPAAWLVFAGQFGWAIGTWIKDVKVGGVTISDHMGNMFLAVEIGLKRTLLNMKEKWYDFLHAITPMGDYMSESADRAELAAERAALAQNEKDRKNTAPQPSQGKSVGGRVGDIKSYQEKFKQEASDGHGEPKSFVANPPGAFAGGKPTKERSAREASDPDPLTKALGEAKGKMDSQAITVKELILGAQTLNGLMAEAAAEVEGKRLADDYSKGHDKKNRPGADDTRIKELTGRIYQEKLQAEQIKALTFGNERLAATSVEATDAMDRLGQSGAAKGTDAFRALNRELARAEERLGAGATAFTAWGVAKHNALFQRARADLANFGADMIDANQADAASLRPTDKERQGAAFDATAKKQADNFAKLKQSAVEERDLTISHMKKLNSESTASGEERVRVNEKTAADVAQVWAEYNAVERESTARQDEFLALQAEKRARSMESPIAAMARQWKDIDKELSGLQTKWADGFVNMLSTAMSTGRLEIGKFFKDVLLDIANAKLKQALADPLNAALDKGIAAIKTGFFLPSDAPKAPAAAAASKGAEGMLESVAPGVKAFKDNLTGAGGAADSLTNSVGETVTKQGLEIAGATTKLSAEQATTLALTTLASAAQKAAVALMSVGGGGGGGGGGGMGGIFSTAASLAMSTMGAPGAGGVDYSIAPPMTNPTSGFKFADGGIMTDYGAVPLRKYASGGVAKSPQLALYGEAGAEAYVPLPDGRSIPVNLSVAGAASSAPAATPAVFVNITNNSGAQVKQAEQIDSRGQRSIDIVIGDMVSAQINRSGSSVNQSMRSGFGLEQTIVKR